MADLTQYYRQPALDETKRQVSAVGTSVWWAWVQNPNSSAVYFQIWNAPAASVTVGTTAPTLTFALAAGFCGPVPLGFSLPGGCTVACTAAADGSGSALTLDCPAVVAFG